MTELKMVSNHKTPALPSHLQRAAQMLWATYESLDLRIETTYGAAEAAFMSALPELSEQRKHMLPLIRHLLSALRNVDGSKPEAIQTLSLRLVYQDHAELIEQLLPGKRAQIVVVPLENAVNRHTTL